jgi:hypothetical protein
MFPAMRELAEMIYAPRQDREIGFAHLLNCEQCYARLLEFIELQ